ncbi:hypothetical protein [Pseudofrankia asymbiotica]|uniref:hypothetical protein n=1 Tax=Pseudofrankia asymbiotica TaxID=1834516 RepID=UPI0010553003|nr:hypothetical protein [Pseudofrankia asymbiotica]
MTALVDSLAPGRVRRRSSTAEWALVVALLILGDPGVLAVPAILVVGWLAPLGIGWQWLAVGWAIPMAGSLASSVLGVLPDRPVPVGKLPGRAVLPEQEPTLCALVARACQRLDLTEPVVVRITPIDAGLVHTKIDGRPAYGLLLALHHVVSLGEPALAAVATCLLADRTVAAPRRDRWLGGAYRMLALSLDRPVHLPKALCAPAARAGRAVAWRLDLDADIRAAGTVGALELRDALAREMLADAALGVHGEQWCDALALGRPISVGTAHLDDLYDAITATLADPVLRAGLAATADEQIAELLADRYVLTVDPPLPVRLRALGAPASVTALTDLVAAQLPGEPAPAPVPLESMAELCALGTRAITDAATTYDRRSLLARLRARRRLRSRGRVLATTNAQPAVGGGTATETSR